MKLFTKDSDDDDYKLVSKVESPDMAVELFQKYLDRDEISFLKFDRKPNDYLELCILRTKEIYIYCRSGKSIFETKVSRDLKSRQISPEDFVKSFCEDTHEETYNFEKEELSEEELIVEKPQVTSTSKFGFRILFPFLFIFAGVFLAITLDGKSDSRLLETMGVLALIISVFMLPYFILVFQYYVYNGNSTLTVSRRENLLTITRNNRSHSIRLNEITRARLVYKTSGRSFYADFTHLILEAGPRQRAVITHFLYEDLHMLVKFLKLKPKEIPAMYPLIWLRRKSDKDIAEERADLEAKVQEFMSKWSNRPADELRAIVESKEEYADYAIEAARRLLKKKPN